MRPLGCKGGRRPRAARSQPRTDAAVRTAYGMPSNKHDLSGGGRDRDTYTGEHCHWELLRQFDTRRPRPVARGIANPALRWPTYSAHVMSVSSVNL